MTDECLHRQCKGHYDRKSRQFSPCRRIAFWSYLQLTHRDRKSVRAEVTKTKNARAISVDWENAGGGTLARSLVVAAFLAILTLAWADIRTRVGVTEKCREER